MWHIKYLQKIEQKIQISCFFWKSVSSFSFLSLWEFLSTVSLWTYKHANVPIPSVRNLVSSYWYLRTNTLPYHDYNWQKSLAKITLKNFRFFQLRANQKPFIQNVGPHLCQPCLPTCPIHPKLDLSSSNFYFMCLHFQPSLELSPKSFVFNAKPAYKLYMHNHFVSPPKERRVRINEGNHRLIKFKRRADTSESF